MYQNTQNHYSNNKRIIKNSLILNVRMIFLIFISFFTSRIVLQNLGIVDFGIQNVVGGLANMFVFFRSSLSNVTQRYLNIKLGANDIDGARSVFCIHQTIYIIISLFVFVFAETIGVWFLYNKLSIPPERITAAFWCFQITIVSMIITILSVVYDASIVAHEDMKIYSYVGMVEGLVKLGIAYAISITNFDRIIVYQLLLFFMAVGIRLFYSSYCSRNYLECKFHIMWNIRQIKEAAAMVGWNTIGTIVWSLNEQGINILLNVFFGPVVNAARAISYQVSNSMNHFTAGFLKSVNPQIIKTYAAKDFNYLFKLFFSSSKYAVFILWILCLPVMLGIDSILKLWLVKVPEYTAIFTIWVLAYSMVNVLNQPIWTLSLAIGKLKYYVLIGSGVFFLAFPIAYLCLELGYPPVSVFVTMFCVRGIYIFVVFSILRKYIAIPLSLYIYNVLFRCVSVIVVSGSICYIISRYIDSNSIIGLGLTCLMSLIVAVICICAIGLTQTERGFAIQYVF